MGGRCYRCGGWQDNLNPTWKAAKISVGSICNGRQARSAGAERHREGGLDDAVWLHGCGWVAGDYDRPLRLDVYDWDKDVSPRVGRPSVSQLG